MLTKKGKYGLKALVHLSRLQPGESELVSNIALSNGIPKKFLDAILGELRNGGFLFSKKGKGGGYMLARPPEEITIGEVIRTLDGPLAPLPCASSRFYQPCEDCGNQEACAVRLMMLEVREAISGVLDNRTLADMRLMADQANTEFDYHI